MKRLILAAIAAILPVLPALAWVSPPYDSYAAPFSCIGTGDEDAPTTFFGTFVRVHNPQNFSTVMFEKQIVVSVLEGRNTPAPVIMSDSLGPGESEIVNCPIIRRAVGKTKLPSMVFGYVTVNVPPSKAGQQQLDVSAEYFQAGIRGTAHSVVPILGKPVTVP